MAINKTDIHTILFVTLSNLGDIILTTPVLERIHEEFPEAKIDVITGDPGKALFPGHPAVREVIVPRRHSPLAVRFLSTMALRRRRYDLAVDLKNSLLPFIVGAKYKASSLATALKGQGARGKGREKAKQHKVYEHLSRLASLGIDISGTPKFFIPVTQEEKVFVDKALKSAAGKKIVVMNPGAKSHLKRWDAAKFADLAVRLTETQGCHIFVVGNDDDKDVMARFLPLAKSCVTDLSSRTSLGALADLMRRSGLVVTNDSAPLHVASAVNAPTVAIFGPTDEAKYGPLASKSIVVRPPDIVCRPCGKALCSIGPDEGCISRLSVEEVFEAARKILTDSSS
jgi:heptosyltransferase-2